jgi:hypothetical protein
MIFVEFCHHSLISDSFRLVSKNVLIIPSTIESVPLVI